VKPRALIAAVTLLTSGFAEASTGARHRAPRGNVSVTTLRSAVAARVWTDGSLDAGMLAGVAPAPVPSPALRSVMPPDVLAALVEAAEGAAAAAPRPSGDGLSWRELRPNDESGTRIMPLAMGRF
jgi:hypothetical protein